jgi:predicted DNA-binding antitoxin AbrB/MazE fold protein
MVKDFRYNGRITNRSTLAEACAMSITVEATYENGALKLERPLPFKEHQRVRVTVETTLTWAERTAGMMGFRGSAEEAEYFAKSPELDFPIPEDDA